MPRSPTCNCAGEKFDWADCDCDWGFDGFPITSINCGVSVVGLLLPRLSFLPVFADIAGELLRLFVARRAKL